MNSISLGSNPFHIQLVDEGYLADSADISGSYEKVHFISNQNEANKRVGIICVSGENKQTSCLICFAGHSELAANSALVIRDDLMVAVGNQVCCIGLPKLDLKWHVAVDQSTVFAIHALPQDNGFVAHGELDIARVSFDGKLIWNVSGKDIFTEGFELFHDHIEVIDFNKEKYRIEIKSGQIELLSN